MHIQVFPSEVVDGRVLCIADACVRQAWYNSEHVYKSLNLKVVAGSLGIGIHQPFYEYGGLDYTTLDDFKNSPYTKKNIFGYRSWDAHVWLEDDAGNVYDVITDYMILVAKIMSKDIKLDQATLIEKRRPRYLKRLGFRYKKFNGPELMDAITADWRPFYDKVIHPCLNGLSREHGSTGSGCTCS